MWNRPYSSPPKCCSTRKAIQPQCGDRSCDGHQVPLYSRELSLSHALKRSSTLEEGNEGEDEEIAFYTLPLDLSVIGKKNLEV